MPARQAERGAADGKPLCVATIGAGYFSQFHHAAWAADPRTTLVGVCDRDGDIAAAFAERFGINAHYTDAAAMLGQAAPDLLDIIAPPPSHRALITLAVAHKVPVICQKPFCESLADARAMVALAQQAGVPLIIHENFRFSPWYRRIRGLLDEGVLGTLYQIAFRLRPGDGQGPAAYLDRQPYFQTMKRFLVHETAIHFIDTFRYLLGEPVSVYADLRRLNAHIKGEDAGHILFDFGDGRRALFDGNRLADHAAANRRFTMGELTVDGSAATLTLSGDGDLAVRPFGTNVAQPLGYAHDATGFAGGAVAALQAHVVDHLLGNAPLENSGEAYLRNLIIEEAVYRSAAEGRRVELQ